VTVAELTAGQTLLGTFGQPRGTVVSSTRCEAPHAHRCRVVYTRGDNQNITAVLVADDKVQIEEGETRSATGQHGQYTR